MHGNDRLMMIVGGVVLLLVLGSSVLFGGSATAPPDDDSEPGNYIKDLTSASESIDKSGELTVAANESVPVTQGTRIIKNLTASLTWVDETVRPGMPRLRRYQNMPDTFTMSVEAPGKNSTPQSAANTAGGEGRIEMSLSFSESELNAAIDAALGAGTPLPDWNVEVVLTDAGDWRTLLPPHLIGFRDDANSYILEIKFEYYDLSELMA
jgi:hypothetical protein